MSFIFAVIGDPEVLLADLPLDAVVGSDFWIATLDCYSVLLMDVPLLYYYIATIW